MFRHVHRHEAFHAHTPTAVCTPSQEALREPVDRRRGWGLRVVLLKGSVARSEMHTRITLAAHHARSSSPLHANAASCRSAGLLSIRIDAAVLRTRRYLTFWRNFVST
jgi:hypothetical protein